MAVMAAGLNTPTPFLCISSTPRQDVHTCSGTSQIALWRSDLRGGLSLSHRVSTKATARLRQFKRSRFVRAAQLSAKNEENVADDHLVVTKQRLRELSENLVLPANYLERLPGDLHVDKDAAFALPNGPLNNECGEQAGDLLIQLSRAWERGDTQAAAATAKQLPTLLDKLTSDSSSEFVGRRCIRARRYFTATGQYEGGELQKIGKALVAVGEAFSRGNLPVTEAPVSTAKAFKFRNLQVEITAQSAYIGAVVSFIFGWILWVLGPYAVVMAGNFWAAKPIGQLITVCKR